jgi:asparagine synthetase B (glutamine-hydrolysing)
MSIYNSSRPPARLGILFSGGIDCSIVAYLANQLVLETYYICDLTQVLFSYIPCEEPIDLINVAFENPRTLGAPQKNAIQEARSQRKRSKKGSKEITLESPTDTRSVELAGGLSETGKYDVPDRVTGLEEVEELRRLCPERQWNFVSTTI